MIYAEIKNPEDAELLNNAIKSAKSKKWYRRLKVVELSAQKRKVLELSNIFHVSAATIRRYIHEYNQGGLNKLAPVKQTGRPPKICHWTKHDWDVVLEQTPDQYKKLATQSRQ